MTYNKIISSFLVLLFLFPGAIKSQDFNWAVKTGGTGSDYAEGITSDVNGNIIAVGNFEGTVDFDPGISVYNMTAQDAHYIQKLGSNGTFKWAVKCSVGGSGFAEASDVCTDADGNIYVVGNYDGGVDFDPGPGSANLFSVNDHGFLQKLDSNGNFIWVKEFPAGLTVAELFISTIKFSSDGNLLLSGLFLGSLDFDPGPGVINFSSPSPTDASPFLAKIDLSGNVIWAKQNEPCVSNSGYGEMLAHAETNSGKIITAGKFAGCIDLDPGPGTDIHSYSPSSAAASIQQFDNAGNYLWGKSIVYASMYDITSELSGNVYVTGSVFTPVDINPGPGVMMAGGTSPATGFILKLDSAGNYVWAKIFQGPGYSVPAEIECDDEGNLLIGGEFNYTVDFNPGVDVFYLTAGLPSNYFLLKLNADGAFLWAGSMGNASNGVFSGDMAFFSPDVWLSSGSFQGIVDFDPGPGVYSLSNSWFDDAYIVNMRNDSCASISIFADSVSHISCATSTGFASAQVLHSTGPVTWLWNNNPVSTDSFAVFNAPGQYTVTATDSLGCSVSRTVIVNGPTAPAGFDLRTSLVTTSSVFGGNAVLWFTAFNDGCTPTPGTMKLVMDPDAVAIISYPPADAVSGDTLIWNTPALVYGNSFQAEILIYNLLSPSPFADSLCFSTIITPTAGDAVPANNSMNDICLRVTGAYDPNDKAVFPAGECADAFVDKSDPLRYRVRFQNVGTAPATDVYVFDTLSPALDLTTVRILAHSHPMIAEVRPGNVVLFRFDGIQLPDSSTDFAASNGFIEFEINPLASVADGTPVQNRASIFFDYNPAITTNTVMNTLVDSVPVYGSSETLEVCSGEPWTFADGYFVPSVTSSITHTVPFITPDGCDSLVSYTLNPVVVNTAVTLSGDTLLTADASNATFQWIDCDNNFTPISGQTAASFNPTTTGNFAVIVTQSSCIDTSGCYSVNATGIPGSHNSSFTISLFPNPVQTQLNLVSNQALSKITLLDLKGIEVRNFQPMSSGTNILDVSGIPAGLYLVYVESREGYYAGKIQIE